MTTIKDAVEDLLNNRKLTADEAVDRHFGPAFRQRTNGSWDDRPAFLARIVLLREVVEHAKGNRTHIFVCLFVVKSDS